MNVIELLYEIREIGFILWLEGEQLHYRQVKPCDQVDVYFEKIKKHKQDIMELLKFNECNHPEYFNRRIFKVINKKQPLSFAQERLWFIEQYAGGSNAYNVPMIFQVPKTTDIHVLSQSLRKIISRHEVLRTIIQIGDRGISYQWVQDDQAQNVPIKTVKAQNQAAFATFLSQEIYYVFQLDKEWPIRVCFYNLDNEIYLSIVIHHIAFDGWSAEIFLRELVTYYEHYGKLASAEINQQVDLPELPIQYKDFVLWQRYDMRGEKLQEQLTYWKNKLTDYSTLNLPLDKSRTSQTDYRGADIFFEIDFEVSNKLRQLSTRMGVSLYSLMLSGYYLLLSSYSNMNDIVIGIPIANRHYSELEELIGFFVNSLALRKIINKNAKIIDFIQSVNDDLIEAQLNQDLPFEKLVEALDLHKDMSRHPVFQTLFGGQPINGKNLAASGHVLLEQYLGSESYEIAKFDLTVMLDETQATLQGSFNYATSLFNAETIHGMIKTYQHLLKQLSNLSRDDQLKIKQLSFLDADQYHKVIYQWNNTKATYPLQNTIHQLFEQQVLKTCDNWAIVDEHGGLTYQQLNQQANQLAHYLRQTYQIKADGLLALCVDRSQHMLVAILAVLKAGGAYVPIDPSWPDERMQLILADTQAKVILVGKKYENRFRRITQAESTLNQQTVACIHTIEVIDDDGLTSKLDHYPTSNLTTMINSQQLAYVIYTSGTTGKPKGVMIEHVNVVDYLFNLIDLDLKAEHVDFSSSLAFDLSVTTTLYPLCVGKTVFPYHGDLLDVERYANHIIKNKIELIKGTPPFLASLSTALSDYQVQYCIVGGEKLQAHHRQAILSFSSCIFDEYGPTEATVGALIYQIVQETDRFSIGRCYKNGQAYVLDDNLTPLPVGAIGELYLGGAGLARGYFNQPELTAKRFIVNPFQTEAEKKQGYNQRLYKTGDLVRYFPDGYLAYLGRNDSQVKIRGFRIELGEIENRLSAYPGIKQAVVLMKERSDVRRNYNYQSLISYYVSDDKLNESMIIDHLAKYLPNYMLPDVFIYLNCVPLTVNGKLDYRALPDPEDIAIDQEAHVAPRNELESILLNIWSDVLGIGVNQISVKHNFFKLGGNSILAIQLKNELNKTPQFKQVSIADLFQYYTIESLVVLVLRGDPVFLRPSSIHPSDQYLNDDIAIIAMSGAFSGGNSLYDFWEAIVGQKEGLNYDASLTTQAQNYIPSSGHIENIDSFDCEFWNMVASEAQQLDPQIRKFLEHCWQALEQSGYVASRRTLNIGIFAGCGQNNYLHDYILQSDQQDTLNLWEVYNANSKDALATKASYLLGLTGPAININTACSTGLVAVVNAYNALKFGICDMALAGAVTLLMPDHTGYVYQEGMIMSKDGHCRVFDCDASGTVAGSGVGVVMLKRFNDALKDRDPIIAVIQGAAMNNDGDRKSGYAAPSVTGQAECIISAQESAGIDAEDIDYVECHGTGTALGDPIEIEALKQAFSQRRRNNSTIRSKCILGAVKANIGHADAAAGIAGLIKVCLMLKHRIMPGQVNFTSPNPELHLKETDFEIIEENRPWNSVSDKTRMAGISSFGVGGTNAHVIVREYLPAQIQTNQVTTQQLIFPLSAKSRGSLEQYKATFLSYLQHEQLDLADIAYTLQQRREHFTHRIAVVANCRELLIRKLNAAPIKHCSASITNPCIIFMFPGQGFQYSNMSLTLYQNDAIFKQYIDQVIDIANLYLEQDLAKVLYPELYGSISEDIHQTQWSQITLFTVAYALAKRLENLGIHAEAYIGHSIGEYVAAVLAGVFDLNTAIELVNVRAQLMQSMPKGKMLAVQADFAQIQEKVYACACEIAVINGDHNYVVSGATEKISQLKTQLMFSGIASIILPTSHAYHSNMMDEASKRFKNQFAHLTFKQPNKRFISNVTGDFVTDEVTKIDYWAQHLRSPVEFGKGIKTLCEYYQNRLVFVEVGPGKGLCSLIASCKDLGDNSLTAVQLLPSTKEYEKAISFATTPEEIISKLWCGGINIDFSQHNDLTTNQVAALPPYQFDSKSYWINKSKQMHESAEKLQLLPQTEWYSSACWKKVCNLSHDQQIIPLFASAVVVVNAQQNQPWYESVANQVIIVILDHQTPEFDLIDDDTIKINPLSETGYMQLASYLKKQPFQITACIHAASVLQKEQWPEKIDLLDVGFYSLFLLKQFVLTKISVSYLMVLTQQLSQITSSDPISPLNGAMVGSVRNIKHELPGIKSLIIDIGEHVSHAVSILHHLMSNKNYFTEDYLLAYRFEGLWVEQFSRVQRPVITDQIVKDHDVILITGGLGGIALAMATALSIKHQLKFILVSRKPLDDIADKSAYVCKQIERIEAIKAKGCQVDIRCCDLADSEATARLLQELYRQYEHINGIIHTAGVSPVATADYSIKTIKHAFGGKVYGIENVIRFINKPDLNYLINTSSLASIMGDVNRIEYCAANSYLDYLAVSQQRLPHTRIISINWPGWSDTGMLMKNLSAAEDVPPTNAIVQQNTIDSLTGGHIFYDLLNQANYQQIVISQLDIELLRRTLFSHHQKPLFKQTIKITEPHYMEEEYKIAQIYCDVLGIDQISLQDDFYQLGGNSLSAIRLINQLSVHFNVHIKLSDLFANGSIAKLANFSKRSVTDVIECGEIA